MQMMNFQIKTLEDVTEIPEIEVSFKVVFTDAISKHISEIDLQALKIGIARLIKDGCVRLEDVKGVVKK